MVLNLSLKIILKDFKNEKKIDYELTAIRQTHLIINKK